MCSAYIVDNKTISNIVQFLDQNNSNTSFITRGITGKYNIYGDDGRRERFGQTLLDMNIAAVKARYSNDEFVHPSFQLESSMVSKIQVYKSLTCFLYQCSEGDIYGSELFNDMQEMANRLAHDIVTDSALYSSAQWG